MYGINIFMKYVLMKLTTKNLTPPKKIFIA